MKDNYADLETRKRFRSYSKDQICIQDIHLQRRWCRSPDSQPSKTKKLLATCGLAIGVCMMILVANFQRKDRIYSHSTRRLATVSSSDTILMKLHLDERYVFDGMHSDFAQQFYRRYLVGDKTEAISDTTDLKEVADYVSNEFGLTFTELPPMLQQAIVWDFGYVAAADIGYVKVYTKCGIRMSELQLSRTAYTGVGCTEQRCASPNGEIFYQSLYCSGYQIRNVSLCAATNGKLSKQGVLWSDGGTDDVVPVSEMQRHEWTNAGVNYTIMAIHLSGDVNSYGKCVIPSMIVPCVAYDSDTADELDWCSPERGELVLQWLELEKTGGIHATETSNWQQAALPVTITSLVLLLFVVCVFWWKTRAQKHRKEEFLDQKRAILGGRESDKHSITDDIDYILEAPGLSFIETGGKEQHKPLWVPWGQPLVNRSDGSEYSEDLDAMLLQSSFGDIKDIDNIYLYGISSHDHSFRSPSKATTAGLTSFASTRQTTSFEPAQSLTDQDFRTMTSVLIDFQNDVAVTSRRVPFVDVKLERKITTGTYTEVWLGKLRGDVVAVKRLRRDQRHQVEEIEVFAAKIQLMASFRHLNVLELVGVAWNTLEDTLLVMEYMERRDLQHVLQYLNNQSDGSVGEFSWASHKARIARDVACGLKYLHSRESIVVHRDLKSKNVLIDTNYEAKLGHVGMIHDKVRINRSVGTAYWTAPEVLAGHEYSEKADVYALGVVLTELDTGELPFFDARTSDGDKMEAMDILSLVVSGELKPSFTLDCPEDVRNLSLACLNPKPEWRPTAKEIMKELNRLLESIDYH